ncbi:MAG TPA: DUF1365 domain-containing protein [Burkholderiaceae bacterium]
MTMNRAQLCFGEVRHRRLLPVDHAFAYGVYFLRLPLRSMETDAPKSRWFSRNRFNLLSFHDADHGDGTQSLTAWADQLLKHEGIDDADGEIWLQTFPRVLGYVFNPVSFWFFHRRDGSLRAILCAVTNTFGEKHSYLLDTGGSMPYGVELQARKRFHVSPFFAIEGDYRFRFMRATRHQGEVDVESTVARIDYSGPDGPLLQTSVSGQSRDLSNARVLHAFCAYPLMTFGVVVKIHWQALRLWLKKVPFFGKPVPPVHKVSR